MKLSEIFKFLKYPKSTLIKNNNKDYIFKFHNVWLILFKEFKSYSEVVQFGCEFTKSGEIPVLISKLDNQFFIFKKYLNKPLKIDFKQLIRSYNYSALTEYLNADDFNISYSPIILKLILAEALIKCGLLKRDNFKKIYNKSFEELIYDKEDLSKFLNYLSKRFKGDIFSLDTKNSHQCDIFFSLPSNVNCLYENDKSHGVYKTPQSMVDYIVLKTINRDGLRVLDPACGSGVFLVSAFQKLIKNKNPLETLKNSIYGVDKNEKAVNITILSLYLELIKNTDDFRDFEFPPLKNINIFYEDFFSKNLDNLGLFDVVIGNIPWFQAKGDEKLFEKYAKDNFIPLSNRQIAESYIPRVAGFLKEDGISSLILTSKILYNIRDYRFRHYLLNKFNISEIFDLTLIRNNLFNDTHWPSFILTFNNKKQSGFIKHISVKSNVLNNILITPICINYIEKQRFLTNDWLFKVLLAGGEDDFNLIRRLKSDYISLEAFVLKHPRLKAGVGFSKSNNPQDKDISKFLNMECVNINKGDLKSYFLKASDRWKYSYKKGGGDELHYAPFILMKASFSKYFRFAAAFSSRNLAFDQNIFAIKGDVKDIVVLKNIMALINSDLFKYFFYMTGNVNVEKNRSPFRERLKFPLSKKIINNEELFNLVLKRELETVNYHILDNEINKEIFKAYDLSDDEIELVRKIQ